jgi:hypothetical protein
LLCSKGYLTKGIFGLNDVHMYAYHTSILYMQYLHNNDDELYADVSGRPGVGLIQINTAAFPDERWFLHMVLVALLVLMILDT